MKYLSLIGLIFLLPIVVYAQGSVVKVPVTLSASERLVAQQRIQEQQSLTHQSVALITAGHQYGGFIGKQLIHIAKSNILAQQTLRNDIQQARRVGLPALVYGSVDTGTLSLAKGDAQTLRARIRQLAKVKENMGFSNAKTLVGKATVAFNQQTLRLEQSIWHYEDLSGILGRFGK